MVRGDRAPGSPTLLTRQALFSCLVFFSACAINHRATDPQPTLPALTVSAPEVSPRPEPAPPASPLPAVKTRAAARERRMIVAPVENRRHWGLVAITTDVISPSQLIGPEIRASTDFMHLPAFPEKLTFLVSWGLLSVGEATLEVDRIELFNGRPAYHIMSQARSNSFCDTFYPVRDLNEAWLDAKTLTSLGYSKKLREGGFFRDEWVLYDRDENRFVSRRTDKDGSFHVRVGTIPASVQDILSSVYFTRAQDLRAGGQVIIDVNTPDNWPLVVVVKDRETAATPLGKFPAVLVEPAMRREGLFIQKGRKLQLWLSDDAAKRPLLMKVEVFFGHITAALHEVV